MEKGNTLPRLRNGSRKERLLLSFIALLSFAFYLFRPHDHHSHHAVLQRCRSFRMAPGPSPHFHHRKASDRFAVGTKPTLVKNAKIWTGLNNGTEVVHGDILLDKGLIAGVGHFGTSAYGNDLIVIDAKGRWVTPGIVDIHSHIGDGPSPALDGAEDDNSLKGTILPWMRCLDGLNTHDDSYALSISGGITTSLVLPGSADAIGGQAFVIKLRKTAERSPSSMLLEPPYQININASEHPDPPAPRWRHMKHACGENPSRVYSDTRMDTIWAFRQAYNKASQIMKQQDEYCSKAEAGEFKHLGDFPDDLQWEALVDVLRGRVKVNVHCYEAVDLDGLVRLSNEFKFPIAAVHHASEAYLVPDLLKRAYGRIPAIALFATNARYKREAYRGSEFGPRILAENGLTVLMKSDHPVLDSRHLIYEAQQAHYYGLPENLAIASVTSNSAEVMGMGHRIGYLRKGWDADLVLWDSHPLALGATPVQVFIDGISQLQSPSVLEKPAAFQKSPRVPNFDKETHLTLEHDGLPPLVPSKAEADVVIFTNVSNTFIRSSGIIQSIYSADGTSGGVAVTRNGRLVCSGERLECLTDLVLGSGAEPAFVDLKGGTIEPALTSYGAPLGLEHINQEPSTNDGYVFEPLSRTLPKALGDNTVARAVDGLLFSTRDALYAYRVGVTTAITAPTHAGFFLGLGTAFSTGASHKLELGAVVQEVTALHTSIGFGDRPSVSTQIATLRRLLMQSEGWFKKVTDGLLPLVVETHSADVIATLVILKTEVEQAKGTQIKLTITGANEAHLVAEHLASAGVGVVVHPRPFPTYWDRRRIAPGPPLSQGAIQQLISHNVTVGLMVTEIWDARNLAFDIGWASLDANGSLSKEEALALGSINVEKLLGAAVEAQDADLVARESTGPSDSLFEGKVVGIISPRKGKKVAHGPDYATAETPIKNAFLSTLPAASMAKASQNVSSSGKNSIVNYFSRQPNTRSSQSARPKQTETRDDTKGAEQKVASLSLSPQPPSSAVPSTSSQETIPHQSSMNRLSVPPETRTRLRSRTPEPSSNPPSPVRPSGKRKAKFCVESETEPESSVIYISKAATGPTVSIPLTPLSPKEHVPATPDESRKRPRLLSPDLSSLDEVPGSVSDEQEMVPVHRSPCDVVDSRDSVAKWRAETTPLSDFPVIEDEAEASMPTADTDGDDFFSSRRVTPPPQQQQPTPPPTCIDQQNLIKTPKTLTVDSKTENMIADIKARAWAAARSSPVEELKPFNENLEDNESDDELNRELEKAKGKAKDVSSAPRYDLRGVNAPASSSRRVSVSPTVRQFDKKKSAPKRANPFHALLKDDHKEQRNGGGREAHRKAQEVMKAHSEMDDDDEGDVELDEQDRQRLFGEHGEEIKGILEGERVDRHAAEIQESRIGVPLWKKDECRNDDVEMETYNPPKLDAFDQYPILHALRSALEADDEPQSIIILESGLLNSMNLKACSGITDHLCYRALCPDQADLGSAAFRFLLNLWSTSRDASPGITLSIILDAIARMGAQTELFPLPNVPYSRLDQQGRSTLVFRLAKLIASSARSRILATNDIPDTVLVLLSIFLDPSTSDDLQRELIITLDTVFQSVADPNVVAELEPIICTKILSFISNFEAVNTSLTVFFLAGGSGRTTRIARWVARSIVLGKTRVNEKEYCHTPSIEPLSALLVQGVTGRNTFQINENTDYVEMGFYVQILAVALSDIPSYVTAELAAAAVKAEPANVPPSSPTKSDKLTTPLYFLVDCLNFAHRKIIDRATDIDRTRTKAALHQLSMRIYFQLVASTRTAQSNAKRKDIHSYFKQGPSAT